MKTIRALVVEDNPDDVELILHDLEHAGVHCEWKRVDSSESFRSALSDEPWDVILSDFTMPQFTAPAALEILKASGKDIPFIIVSGSVGEAIAVQAMKAGAHDFFAKTNLHRLGAAVEREIREATVRHERHEAVAKLRSVEERDKLIVENVRDYAIFMLDPDGRVASWNQGAERLTGYGEKEILGSPLSIFFPEEERRAGMPERAFEIAGREGTHVGEGARVRRDGSRFWALCTIDCIRPDATMLGYSVILRDITEKKRLLDDLQQAVRARDEFLSIASHELKTPLTSMNLQLESLSRLMDRMPDARLSDDKIAKKLDIIERQAERLSVLINSLLDVTRIASQRLDLSPEKLRLGQVVETVVARMQESIDRAGCQVTVHAKRAVSGTWDRRSLEAVIGTMLSNAIKYGAGKPVDLTVDGDRARARVHVQDRGIGISPEEQARIFERFERAVPEQHYGGLGLGLWVVRQMVEAHHGTVRVDSRPGEGSTFTVELPTEPGILRPAAVPKWLRRHWLGVKRAWMRRDTLSR